MIVEVKDLLYVAEEILDGLVVIDKFLRGYHDFVNDEINVFYVDQVFVNEERNRKLLPANYYEVIL